MKKIILCVMLVCMACVLFSCEGYISEKPEAYYPGWYSGADGYKKALAEHKETGKPLAVYFHADWCAPCKVFAQGTLADKEVREYLKGLVKVHINPEKNREADDIALGYRIMGYPSFYIVIKSGREGRIVRDLFSPSSFIKACKLAGG